MLFIISVIGVISLIKVAVETPVLDNTKTMYCTADVKYNKVEQEIGDKKSCTKGSMKVEPSTRQLNRKVID
jgi:hypothetical protein